MSYKIENTNKDLEIIKRNKIENLELKKNTLSWNKRFPKGDKIYIWVGRKKNQ